MGNETPTYITCPHCGKNVLMDWTCSECKKAISVAKKESLMKITTRVKTRKKIKQRLILTHKPCEEIFPPFEELDKQFRIDDHELRVSMRVVDVDKEHSFFRIENQGHTLPRSHSIPFNKSGYKMAQKYYLQAIDSEIGFLLGKYYTSYIISENTIVVEEDFN